MTDLYHVSKGNDKTGCFSFDLLEWKYAYKVLQAEQLKRNDQESHEPKQLDQ